MASFYAELHLGGFAFPIVRCNYAAHQSTDARGRVNGKVQHTPMELELDVPDSDFLVNWATTPFKPLAGKVIFYDDQQSGVSHESISFAAGQCVGYHEEFYEGEGDDTIGAYRCSLTITAPAFELHAGSGPLATVAKVLRSAPAVAVQGLVAAVAGASSAPAAGVAAAAGAVATAALAGAAPAVRNAVVEYTRKEFFATMKGAEHVRPKKILRQLYDLFNTASAASVPGKPSIPDWKKLEDLLRSTYYKDPNDHNKVKPLNDHWPPAHGGYQRQTVQLKEGDVYDRFQGTVFNKKIDPTTGDRVDMAVDDEFAVVYGGDFMSAMGQAGTQVVPQSFESRALDRAKEAYPFAYNIKILKDVPLDLVPAELAQVIPWYGQPGGGTQTRVMFPKDAVPEQLKGEENAEPLLKPKVDPTVESWKYQEWQKMQDKGYAKVDLTSSPSGDFEILPGNRVRKLSEPKKLT